MSPTQRQICLPWSIAKPYTHTLRETGSFRSLSNLLLFASHSFSFGVLSVCVCVYALSFYLLGLESDICDKCIALRHTISYSSSLVKLAVFFPHHPDSQFPYGLSITLADCIQRLHYGISSYCIDTVCKYPLLEVEELCKNKRQNDGEIHLLVSEWLLFSYGVSFAFRSATV